MISNIVLKSLQRCPALCFNSKSVKNLEEWQNDSGLKHCILKTLKTTGFFFFFFLWGIIWHLDWQGEEILIYTDVKQREENCSKTKKIKIKKIQQRKPSVTCKKGAICSSACRAHSGHLCPGPHSLRDQSQYSYENWAKKKKKRRNMKHPSLKELLLSFKPHNTGKVLASPWNDARLILSAHSRAKTFHAAGTAEVLPFRAALHRLAQSPATGMSCSG